MCSPGGHGEGGALSLHQVAARRHFSAQRREQNLQDEPSAGWKQGRQDCRRSLQVSALFCVCIFTQHR